MAIVTILSESGEPITLKSVAVPSLTNPKKQLALTTQRGLHQYMKRAATSKHKESV